MFRRSFLSSIVAVFALPFARLVSASQNEKTTGLCPKMQQHVLVWIVLDRLNKVISSHSAAELEFFDSCSASYIDTLGHVVQVKVNRYLSMVVGRTGDQYYCTFNDSPRHMCTLDQALDQMEMVVRLAIKATRY